MVAIDLRKVLLEERQRQKADVAVTVAASSAAAMQSNALARQALLPLESYAVGTDRLQVSCWQVRRMRPMHSSVHLTYDAIQEHDCSSATVGSVLHPQRADGKGGGSSARWHRCGTSIAVGWRRCRQWATHAELGCALATSCNALKNFVQDCSGHKTCSFRCAKVTS